MRREREAQGVGAVGVDDVDGIDAVALGFAHPLALAVEDRGIDGDVMEGNAEVLAVLVVSLVPLCPVLRERVRVRGLIGLDG